MSENVVFNDAMASNNSGSVSETAGAEWDFADAADVVQCEYCGQLARRDALTCKICGAPLNYPAPVQFSLGGRVQ